MKTVAYYRVSTRQQGNSGLGIEAQRETVKAFLAGKDARFLGLHFGQTRGLHTAADGRGLAQVGKEHRPLQPFGAHQRIDRFARSRQQQARPKSPIVIAISSHARLRSLNVAVRQKLDWSTHNARC